MAASLLEDNLRSLQLCLTGDAAQKEQSIAIIADLNQICVQEITEKDIDFCCSSLFDKDYGLVVFLSKAITIDELQGCKAKVLEFLSEFIEKVGKKILPYAVDIKDICVSLFSRDRFAKVKNAAMPVLSRLLELTVGSPLGKDLQIDKLITKFFSELTKATSKLTPTVREKIYILLGVIAEVYPEYMTQYSERLTGIYLGALKAEIGSKTRKPEFSIISGCLEGLCSSLVNFTESADEGSRNAYEIFKYARNAIDPKVEFTRFDVPRAGLKLFAKHASQFNLYLIDDYQNLYEKMSYWSHHKNSEMVLLGMKAIESFLTQISEMLVEKAKEGEKDGVGIFKYFVHQFQEIMRSDSAGAKELSLAIRGYGLLAAPCKSYLAEEDVQFMFVEMLNKTEQQFLGQVEDFENRLYNLASYLESLASIIRHMDEVTDAHAISLEHLLVLLLENIPNIHPSKHYICMRAILWVLLAVMPKGTAFKQILSGFVFQGLIRTCSYVPVVETENEAEAVPEDLKTKKITYKDFMETWSGLLDAAKMKDFAAADIGIETRNQLTEAFYNELMVAILKILDKLDLSSTAPAEGEEEAGGSEDHDETGLSSADPLLGVQAKKPKDFQVFINLVDFCKDLLPVKHYQKFECWVFTFTHRLILMSTDNPLASGFYKLLSISMKIANKLNYFQNQNIPTPTKVTIKSEVKLEPMEVDGESQEGNQQKQMCYLLVKKFSKEVLVRMKQYRDDLLASCLTFILSLPKEVISEHMSEVIPAVQVTLNLGLSYLPLAMVAMDALEFWSSSLPVHVMLPFYPKILPCLDSFLKTVDQGAEDVNVSSSVSVTKSKSGRGRKKLSVKLIKGKKETSAQSYRSMLSTMKKRILKYLGRLGGSVNMGLLANADEEISQKAIAWDSMQHLKFDVPFEDMKPTIYLDAFLPHIVELATKSSDRQTKVAACELLHSLIIYCLGRSAQQPGARVERASMAGLYVKLFPAMLKLACDVEQVAKQLFEPLTMQLIHWFTSNKQPGNEEKDALLDAVYDGMIQASDTALRDFSARCLHEFLKWTIRQTTTKALETNPSNVKSVLRRLYSYSLHPNPFKRLGAALAFNNIYTVFREEEPLVNMFTFELLVHFVESLAIAHSDEKSLGTQEQCCKALEHLEKIIRHKAALLRNASKLRIEPKAWSTPTLDIAIRWLLRQCGRPQTECRHACMKLSYQLCTLVPGIKTPVKFFTHFCKDKGPEYFIQRFEGGGHTGRDKHGIEGFPTLDRVKGESLLQTSLSWFDMVLAALDCYTWVFGENLLTPADLFGAKTKDGSKHHVFESLNYFLVNMATVDMETVAELFSKKGQGDFFTPKEKDDFNRAKCTVIVRLLGFLTVMLAKFKKETLAVVPKDIWKSSLWQLICACVVEPSAVGFNMGDVEIMKNLPQEMTQTLVVFSRSFKNEMASSFITSLSGNRNLVALLPLTLDDPGLDHLRLQQLLSGYGQLHSVGLLLPCLQKTKQDVFCQKLFDNVYQGISVRSSGSVTSVALTPTALVVAKEMLKLSFSIGLPAKRVIEGVLDKKKIGSASQASEQAYGDLFFSMFRSSICQYCVTCIKEVVPLLVKQAESDSRRVCTILTSTVDLVCRDRELRKKDGSTVMECILSHWKSLSCWWEKKSADLQGLALLLLTKLLLIDSKFASTPSHPAFEDVFSMYQYLLTDTKTSLSFKCRVLELLPFFANAPDVYPGKLKSSLDRLVANNFPLRSSEFPKGSPKFQDYITAIDRILSALQLSGSSMLLEFLISIFCRETQHVHEDEIQNAIDKFTRRLGRDKQKAAMDVPWKIFVKTGGFPAEIRRATIERVCLSMLRICSKSAMLEFFMDHIVQIRELLEAKLSKSSEAILEGQLVNRLCCFQLLEVLYSRCSKDEVVGTGSAIVRKFAGGKVETGKELTVFISKLAQDAKSEDIRDETTLLELRRQYHCAAYNFMIAFISRTQSELKFFTTFLFEEKQSKGQFLLDNFVDKNRQYEFPIELVSPLERKKKFVSIHQEVREGRQTDDDDSYEDITPSVHLASQYLADSSLSEDISQYNFSISGTTSSWSSQGGRRRNKSRAQRNPEEDPELEVTVEEDYVELEMDPLNQHECMAAMIAVIKHMQRTKITPEVTAGTKPKMPSWMEKLHDKMVSSSTHYNIKLFIAKLIGNTAEVFEPYASYWIKPFCQIIISGPLSGGGINYFTVDLLVTMLGWHKTAIPQDTAEEKAMASRLVHFVIKNVYHETRPVFRNNLEMLKTLLECWKDRVEIPYQEIYAQLLQSSDPKAKDNSVGIQVLGVVIACKFPPYGPSAPVDRERFFSKVANNMGSSHKMIFAPAAEVVGLIFHYLAEKEDEHDSSFHSYVSNLMTNLHKAKPDNFIISVHRMQKHHPPIADRFLNKLLFMLPNLHGEFRTLCLEILHSRIDNVENVFLELKSKGIMASLSHRDEATQLISLKIIKAVAAKMKAEELGLMMSHITAFGVHPSASCRLVMFDILMWIYDNYKDEDTEVAHKILLQTKESLLRGLGDDDQHCRLQVQNFWSSETRLPRGTLDRMVAMLEAMYSPVTEQQYLSYATNLLLEMTSKSPDYQKEIFEYPLSECKFSDYAVKSSWRQRHAAMTPLFATMASQSVPMDFEDSVDGQVRATQDVQQFTQTVEPGASKGPYNWLTQSSLDTYADVSVVPMDTQASLQSSLLFSVGTADSQGRAARRPRPGPGFGKQRLTAPKPAAAGKKEEQEQGSELLRLKRRFLKDQEQSRIYFAKRQTRLKQMREMVIREQATRRENQVTMYRKYRSGDLPDIQIKYSYIIAPLQALAHRDSTIAKLLFGMVFKAIFEKMGDVKTERELEETVDQINSSMDNILSASTQYYSPFIGCILDILYQLRRSLKVDVANVGGAAIFSKLQPLGIAFLEEQLIIHEPSEGRASKRSRTDTQVSTDVAHWIELSRLYKTIEDYDVLLGIFSGKLGTQPITQKAIEAEARADYSTARKLYEEALQCDDWEEAPLDAEVDLWDDCRMDCLANLAQWDALEAVSSAAVDDASSPDLNKVWDDTFFQEHYLPFILQSKVKLMLQGDENQQSLLNFIDSAMKVPDRKLILENRYSQELALMYLWQEDYDRARHYASMAQEFFLQEWSSTDSLMASSRNTALQKLQPLVELQEFLEFMADEHHFSSLHPAKTLVREWNKRTPDLLTDPVGVWDDVVTNRYVYLDHINGRLQKHEPDSQDSADLEADDIFLDTKLRLKLKMAESCKEQNNFTLTLRILKETHSSCKRAEDESLMFDWAHLYASTHHKKTRGVLSELTEESIGSVFTTLDQLKKLDESECLTERPSLGRRHHVLNGQGFELLALAVKGYGSASDLAGTRLEQKFLDYTGLRKLNKQELTEQLIQNGYQRMKAAISIEDAAHQSSTKSLQFQQDEAYIATAIYCDSFLRLKEDDELQVSNGSLKSFPDTVVVCLLKAIKMENMEARQRFPRLLQLVELYPDTMATFVAKSKEVPNWLFLMWISQMLAILDKPEAPAVHNIVMELSSNYPQAIVYPLKLSQEGYNFGTSSKQEKNRQFVDKLKSGLSDDRVSLTSKFMIALECFSQPDQDFKDFFDEIKKLIKKKDRAAIKREYKLMYERMLDYQKPETQSARGGKSKSTQQSGDGDSLNTQVDSATDIGSYARKWSDKYKKEFDKVFGSDGSKLANMSYEEFMKQRGSFIRKFDGDIKGKDNTLKPPATLSEYSVWMSKFNPNIEGRGLEIPGQYTGINKPLPEYHVKIAGFDQRILVMSSLRKPKRITIRGNDEKDYNFLVKGGEDLRQDQRIEQLFYIMNQVFKKDPACRQRKLFLETYQVIPVTTRVGLIEWVANTKPLKDFLYQSMTEAEKRQNPLTQHNEWIWKASKKDEKDVSKVYQNVYSKYSYTDTQREMNLIESKIPWDLSRRSFHNISTSPEAFHVLRCKCVQTHAVISICHYIIGIGDRHLSNFMVNMRTGEMVGIDFGHAFGSATTFLPVPELLPFRLTRQLCNLMLPLAVKGLIESTMIHTLRALRSDSDLLLNTMDIFVKEPSLDWLQNAEKQVQTMNKEDIDLYDLESDVKMDWYPKEKINYVKRKLKGDNPAYITRDELKLGHGKKSAFKDFELVALGMKDNARAQLPATGLSVEQQVSALIDQVTDPNILGRTWIGWEAWV